MLAIVNCLQSCIDLPLFFYLMLKDSNIDLSTIVSFENIFQVFYECMEELKAGSCAPDIRMFIVRSENNPVPKIVISTQLWSLLFLGCWSCRENPTFIVLHKGGSFQILWWSSGILSIYKPVSLPQHLKGTNIFPIFLYIICYTGFC